MKTFGNLHTRELISIPLDDDGNSRLETLAPTPMPDDWTPPVVVPLVKLEQPDCNPATHRCTPVLVWFPDRVERQWVSTPLTDEELAALARKIWPNAAAFLAEFTMPELAAISLSLDPTIAALRLLLASWPADIYSDDPRIVGGLSALVGAEIISELTRAEILAK
jgi:hypothetical protein